MASFACDFCGDIVKHKNIDKHREIKCKGSFMFTCIDCGKIFKGTEYQSHTSCVPQGDLNQEETITKYKEVKHKRKEENKAKEAEQEQKEIEEAQGSIQKEAIKSNSSSKVQNKTPIKSILKNKEISKTPSTKPFDHLSKFEKIGKEAITENIEKTNISDVNICDNNWIKENLLNDEKEFIGWKKTIKKIMNLLGGKSAIKKKFKKCLRKTYELSNSFGKEGRKDLNTVIETEIKESKCIKIFADLIENTGLDDEE